MNKRCMGCMEQYDSGLEICPYCGYVEGTGCDQKSQKVRLLHEDALIVQNMGR